jgi:uncharacterized linocin/CFP29 family protein
MLLDINLNSGGFASSGTGVTGRLASPDFNPAMLRPWISPKNGKTYVTLKRFNANTQKIEKVHQLVTNAPVALPRDSWKLIDRTVTRAALQPLTFVNQVRATPGLEFNIPDGFGTMTLESYTGSDITGATISMEGTRRGDFDRPEYDTRLLPLPIIHKDFQFPARQIAVSRRAGVPLDTTTSALAGRKVAEEIEKLALGVSANNGYAYGGGTVYGVTNHPNRLTKVLTNPTAWGATGPATLINEILAMIEQARVAGYFGPFRIVLSPGWSLYLDADYATTYPGVTLRQRILSIEGVTSIAQANYLTGLQLLLVQMQPETIRMVVGMDITTMMWETLGGMEVNFKVMAIIVPQVRADHAGNAGIVHGTAP